MYTLLIVDDEAIEREALKFIVKNSSLTISEVKEASHGQEALSIAEVVHPDIVILDIKMPGMNGLEVAKKLKVIKEDVKIIMLTAYDRFDYAQEALHLGVEAFIVKPESNEQTIEAIKDCIVKLNQDKKVDHHKAHLELRLNQAGQYLQDEFVDSIVNGALNAQQTDDYLVYMLHDFHEGFGVVIEFDFLDSVDVNPLHANRITKKILERLTSLSDQGMQLLVKADTKIIYLLVYGYLKEKKLFFEGMIQAAIHQVILDSNERLKFKVNCGFGDAYGQANQLWQSFAQAKVACRVRLSEPRYREDELCASIIEGHEAAMIQVADQILDDIVCTSEGINAIRLKLYEGFILLNRRLNEKNYVKLAVPENVFLELENIHSKSDAKIYTHRYLYRIFEAIRIQNNNETDTMMHQVVQYIHNNYSKSFTLEALAYKYGFSTYYFGKLFKQSVGVSFADYLSNLRIHKAKQFLSNPDLTIQAITYCVGYNDPNYFTRIFKKKEGMTPTEYRNKIMLA